MNFCQRHLSIGLQRYLLRLAASPAHAVPLVIPCCTSSGTGIQSAAQSNLRGQKQWCPEGGAGTKELSEGLCIFFFLTIGVALQRTGNIQPPTYLEFGGLIRQLANSLHLELLSMQSIIRHLTIWMQFSFRFNFSVSLLIYYI